METDTPGGVSLRWKRTPREGCPCDGNGHPGRGAYEGNGHPERGVPTPRTSVIARFVGTFKRFCNKEYGQNIWQARYYDHVIRNQQDYDETWEYIDNNPRKWMMTKQGIDA